MSKIGNWFHAMRENYKKKAEQKRAAQVREEAMSRLQAREFNGKIFLCFDNVPILETEDLTLGMAASVKEARQYFMTYRGVGHEAASNELYPFLCLIQRTALLLWQS